MGNFKESQMFLDSTKRLLEDMATRGLSVVSSSSLNEDTAYELVVSKEEGTEEKLERLVDCGVLAYDGNVLNEKEDTYTIIYCQKTPERILKDSLMNYLSSLGFTTLGIGDTDPNKGFICSVTIADGEVLKKLENYKTLIFDGYTAIGTEGNYELVYIFPEGN